MSTPNTANTPSMPDKVHLPREVGASREIREASGASEAAHGDLLALVRPLPQTRWVVFYSYGSGI